MLECPVVELLDPDDECWMYEAHGLPPIGIYMVRVEGDDELYIATRCHAHPAVYGV